jgi:cytochrome c biogenesis protein CcmG/thiol:disulfide interchange protein DsbE
MAGPPHAFRVRGLVALVVALGAACSSADVPKFVSVSGRAPAISGEALLGGTVSPADYRGKILVVNFWNYDCPPCLLEQPVLQSDWERLRSRGLFVIGLMYVGGSPPFPGDEGEARAYLRRFGVTYPAIVDRTSALSKAFGIPGIPSTVVVDPSGRMRFRLYGRVRPGVLEEALVELATAS